MHEAGIALCIQTVLIDIDMVIKGLRGILLLVLCNLTALAQMPVLTLEHLTTKEGLPSNDVWCLNQDKKGFLWIGTGRNICRYDGYSFLRLDSLQLGYCSGIGTDSKGDIYTSVDTRGLCKIDAQTMKVRTVAFNNYDDQDPSNDLHEQSMVDSHDQVWVCDYTSVKRYNPKTNTLHRYTFKQLASGGDVYQYASFFEDKSGTLWIISEIGLFRYDRPRDKLVCVLGQEAESIKNRIQVRLCRASEDSKGDLWIGGYEYGLVHYSPKDGSFDIRKPGFEHNNVLCAQESLDENGRKLLFVGTSDGVSLLYPQTGALYHLPEFYNTGVQVKDMFDDRVNGILWIGTNEGVYKYRYRNAGIRTAAIPANIVRLPVQVTTIQAIPGEGGDAGHRGAGHRGAGHRDAGHYLLGLSHSGVMEWKPSSNQFRLMRFPRNALTQQLRWINGHAYAFTDKGIFKGDFEKGIFETWEPGTRFFSNQDFRDGLMDKKGRLWIGNLNEGLKVIDPKTNKELTLWPSEEERQLVEQSYIKGMVEGLDGRIWIATCSRGLFYFDESKRKFINIAMLPINRNKKLILGGACINGMQLTKEGNLLIASWGGVAKVSAAGEVLHVVSFKTDALKDTYCANLAETPDGDLWFSTNEGIHIANSKTNSLRYITTIEGLRSNAPVGFFYDGKNTLILGQTNTLNVLNIGQLSATVNLPRILLSTAEVKGNVRHQDFSKEMVLKPDENAVTFNFTTLGFEPMSQNQYSYQLEGFEKQWVDLGNLNSVSFTNLREGSYVLNVMSRNSSGVKSPRPLAVHFTIEPHFTNTWFFRILIGLSIAGLIVGMMRWRVSTLDERNKLDLQIAEWRLKALQSQMNPHFLFNSMNSVQNYLLTNRGVEGAKYLSKFSKLVRRIMENSNHQYLPFEKIIETLKMYVEIESFRFNHEFSYVFDIEENEALLDVLLPPMLLQPYIENAIWHGLMPKDGEKKLTITARLQNKHIVCTIEDNGVGRSFSPRTEGHISRGQEMTKGIFESLRRKDSEAKLELVDLFDENQKAAGTRVIMIIPIDNV